MNWRKTLFILALAAALSSSGTALAEDGKIVGLDALGDRAALDDLAAHGLGAALDRAFDASRIPADQRDALRVLLAFHRLEENPPVGLGQRQEFLDVISAGVDSILDRPDEDAPLLLKQGQILAQQGVDPQTGILEYWGTSEAGRAKLKPMAAAAVKIYGRAFELATAHANDLANRIFSPNDQAAVDWQKATDVAGAAEYQKVRMQCAQAQAMMPGEAHRRALIDEATATLARWDNPDSGIQPQERFLQAKLRSLSGAGQIEAVRQAIETLIDNPDGKIVPPPTPLLRFEARCYLVIVNLGAGDIAAAQVALDFAQADQKAHFANDRVQAATLRLLDYRILAMKADQAADGPDKTAANAAAVAALQRLMEDFPALRDVIFQQLASRMLVNADLTQIDPLLLEAMVELGRQQVIATPQNPQRDGEIVRRALGAAGEIMARYRAGTLAAGPAVMDASLLTGIFEEYLGQKISAVNALLDHIALFGNNPQAKGDFALDRARNLIGELLQANPNDPQIRQLQDRFLPIAVNPPFNRREFALQYAASLFGQGKWAMAVQYYRMVPDNEEPQRLLSARYGELVALKNELEQDSTLSPAERAKLFVEVQRQADSVRAISGDLLASSAGAGDKQRARTTLARTTLLAADMARLQQEDPKRVLDLLSGFEALVRGLPDAMSMVNGAMFLRVQAYMQLGRHEEATRTLVQYLNSAGADEGAQTVHDLLAALNDDLDKARDAGDTAKVRQLAGERAALSGYLVKWAQTNADPKIHGYAYIYGRFDADTKRLAATLETDPVARRRDLTAAITLYRQLQSPENFALYQATIGSSGQAIRDYPDPLVSLGIGLIAYDLQDCRTVKSTLGPLIQDEKLGDNNDQYWEATFKLLDCMHTLAQSGETDTTDAQVGQSLKILYLIWREGTGGPKWHAQFEKLRKEVLPGWSVPAPAAH